MKIEILQLGQLQTNCYIAHCGGEAIIIDPADEAEFIAEKIQRLNLKPTAILATHGHFDHIFAAGELQMILDIPFYIHQADEFLLKKMNESARFWLEQKINRPLPQDIKFIPLETIPHRLRRGLLFKNNLRRDLNAPRKFLTGFIKKGFSLKFGDCRLKVVETPGHTPGSVCFAGENVIFSGDTLFKNGAGRTDFSYSDANSIKKSLEKIFRLPPRTIVYPGHGEETAIGIYK